MKRELSPQEESLLDYLLFAVYLEVPFAAKLTEEERHLAIKDVGRVLGEKSDLLLCHAGSKADRAKVLAELVRGLSVGALCPGGIRFLGHYFFACPSCLQSIERERHKNHHCPHCNQDLSSAEAIRALLPENLKKEAR